MKEIKVRGIGAGSIACSAHIPNYQKIDGLKIIAVADMKKKVANDAAKKFDIPNVFTDYRDLLLRKY